MPTYRPSHRSHAATPRPAHPRQHGRAGSFRSPERLASGNRAGTVGSLSLGAWLSPWGRWRSSVVPPWPRGLHVLFHGRLPPPSLVECPFFGPLIRLSSGRCGSEAAVTLGRGWRDGPVQLEDQRVRASVKVAAKSCPAQGPTPSSWLLSIIYDGHPSCAKS